MKPLASKPWILSLALAFLAPGCSSSGSGGSTGDSGSDSTFLLTEVEWGRLVDVLDARGLLVKANKVIEPDILTNATYTLGSNSLTDQPTVTIQFVEGTSEFDAAFAALDDSLPSLGVNLQGVPPFTPMPRDAALKLTFNNEIDSSTLDTNTVSLFQGTPPTTIVDHLQFVDSEDKRVLILDPTISQYDADQEGKTANLAGLPPGFSESNYNVKISIFTKEAASSGAARVLRDGEGNALEANESSERNESTSLVRIFRSGLATDAVGEFLADSRLPKLLGIRDISIASSSAAGDKRRISYTFDTYASADCSFTPGVGDIFVQGSGFGLIANSADILSSSSPYEVDLTLLQGAIAAGTAKTRHIYDDDADSGKKPCFIDYSKTPTEINLGSGYIAVDPDTEFTLHFTKAMRAETVLANDTFLLGNDDDNPLTPANSSSGYFGLNSSNGGNSGLVPVQINPSNDRKSYTMAPFVPLRNDGSDTACSSPGSGIADDCYYLHLLLDDKGPTDLAGNGLPTAPDAAGTGGIKDFQVSAIHPTTGTTYTSGGVALRFNTSDLAEDGATGNQVIAGQISTPTSGRIFGRPVQRFSGLAAQGIANNPRAVLDIMSSSSLGTSAWIPWSPVVPVKAPLSPLGSRMMTVYRYHDVGLTMGDSNFDGCVDDFSTFNLDVEGMWWAADNDLVIPDQLSDIEIRLSHSRFFPDEINNYALCLFAGATAHIVGCFENSGLLGDSDQNKDFDDNIFEDWMGMDPAKFGPKSVYRGSYVVNPAKAVSLSSPTMLLYPWPEFSQNFTWRDTELVVDDSTNTRQTETNSLGFPLLGGPNTNGIDPTVFCQAGLFSTTGGGLVAACTPVGTTVWDCGFGYPGIGDEDGCYAPIPVTTANADWNTVNNVDASKITGLGWPPESPKARTAPSIASVGLPLLVDFLVQSEGVPKASNNFKTLQANPTQVAFESAISGDIQLSLKPYFRLLSAGNFWLDGSGLTIQPENETSPRGEVASIRFPPDISQGGDDVFYMGQLDFVTTKSMAFTRWFDTGGTTTTFNGFVLEPATQDLAALGVDVEISFRGGTADPSSGGVNAAIFDPYGNNPSSGYSWDCTSGSYSQSTEWVSDITDLNSRGVRAVQARIVLRGNASEEVAAWIDSLQISWTE